MSELINNSENRKKILKELILQLHEGNSQELVKKKLVEVLSQIPYGEVVEVEQELISEGLPEEEILQLCDVHGAVLDGHIDLSGAADIPEGHPVDVFIKENVELKKVADQITGVLDVIGLFDEQESLSEKTLQLRALFNSLYDVDKHYQRKEYLLFPFLEKAGITGPPKVMWGKHDEIRELIKGSMEALQVQDLSKSELLATAEILFLPATLGVTEMVKKEEEILFPMAMDTLNDEEWIQIDQQTIEFGFCLYDPLVTWDKSAKAEKFVNTTQNIEGSIQLPSGSLKPDELMAILNSIGVDMTFVDKHDKVKYFTQGEERIFQRNRAILNRDVRHCHPPASAHIVDKILDDFKSGKAKHAPFWINMGGKMIHIEYVALHNEQGEYLGVLEVSQNVNRFRELQGEQRILSYSK